MIPRRCPGTGAWSTRILLGIIGAGLALGVAAAEIPEPLQRILRGSKIPAQDVSLLVQALDEAEPLIALNIDELRNPASTMKLVTTYTALNVLGPTYTWPTEVYALGPVTAGTIKGGVLFKGYGDPNLAADELWKLLGELRRMGIQRVTGDMVIDDSHFAVTDADSGAFDHQPYKLYNVVPNAFLVNFKAVDFHFSPGSGNQVVIQTVPDLPNLIVNNKLMAKTGPCGPGALRIAMDVPDQQRLDQVVFSGTMPTACRGYTISKSLMQPEDYAFGLVKTLWGQWGGTIEGGVRRGVVPRQSRRLLVWKSRPLAETIRDINKWSNNVMARMLLYTLATARFGPPATPQRGAEVIRHYLATQQIDTTGLVIDNGAGLSRQERISARQMNSLLRSAYRGRFMPEFMASLSIPGLDGTMRKRFPKRPEAGSMHVKTGRLDAVVAIAGYVLAKSGRVFTVVMFINHRGAEFGPGSRMQDALLSWAYNQ